jgi:hypothetical protein
MNIVDYTANSPEIKFIVIDSPNAVQDALGLKHMINEEAVRTVRRALNEWSYSQDDAVELVVSLINFERPTR